MSEKTEDPTPKKLRDARKKGQVAHSKDVVAAAMTVGLFLYFWTMWDDFLARIRELLVFPPQFYKMAFSEAAKFAIDMAMEMINIILVPVLLITVLLALVSNMAMVGVLFAAEGIKPSLDKINPASGFKRIFAIKSIVETLKSIVKIVFLTVLIYLVIRGGVEALVQAPGCGIGCLQLALSELLTQMMIYTCFAFVIVGAADFAYQKFQHTKGLKMSKDEVKREYKESEGDPHVKGMRKQLMHELLMSDEGTAVRNSSVVVTNPTHIAVALRYEPGQTPLPMVVAKGQNLNAERIIAIAREAGVPIMQNIPLAHSLFNDADLDRYIPSELIEPVAEVLRWVRELKRSDEG